MSKSLDGRATGQSRSYPAVGPREYLLLIRCRARDGDKDKDKPGRLQVLHYNIERFPDEIKDLRGLETLLVAT